MRRADWEPALAAYVSATERDPHAYGVHDCALDAADAVRAMTGIDYAAEFRGRYRSAAGAVRALRDRGRGSLEATLDAKFQPVAIGFARRGDLALHEGAIGIVMGPFALFLVEGAAERVRVPRGLWEKAWAV